jgi:hypothetical protein
VSLLDLSTDETIRALPPRIDAPKPAPERKFSTWKAITAVPRGITEGLGAQFIASTADVLGGFGQVLGAYPEAMGVIPTEEQRKQTEAQRQRLLTDGVDMSSEAGDLFREAGRGYRPDPTTAHAAEQVLYGFARGASKVVAGAVAGGVPGVLVAGAEEGMSAADDLKREGVGPGARTMAGAVQGAGLALAALPAAGQTLRGTLALYAAGGPGGYVAQQALTREILQRSGFEKQAEQFDPFDPVGLAVSALIPAPFAAYGLRANRRAAAEAFRDGPVPSEPTAVASAVQEAMPREVVDAAMVAHQRLAREASNPAPMAARSAEAHEAALTKAEQQIAAGEPVRVSDVAAPYITPAERDANFRAWSQDAPLIPAMSGHTFKTGQPIVADAFHGTTRDFDSFSNLTLGEKTGGADARAGHFLSDNPGAADQFTWENGDKSGHIMPAYVRMLNPLVSDHFLNGSTGTAAGKIIEEAKRAGHDGVIFPRSDMLGNEGATFVAFDPKQVKSATGNSGRFDPNSPSLTDPLTDFAAGMRALQETRADAPTTPQAANPEAAAPARGAGDAPTAAGAADAGRPAGVEAAGRADPVTREQVALRKRSVMLNKLMECLNG